MTRKEQLREQYEDALFALLMDDFADHMGTTYERENEYLKQNENFVIPESTDKKCLQTIKHAFTKSSVSKVKHISAKLFTKIAVAVFIAVIMATAAFALSPQLRTTALTFLLNQNRDSIDIAAITDNSAILESDNIAAVKLGYLPVGFALNEEYIEERFISRTYCNAEGKTFFVEINADVGILSIDAENATVTHVTVQGNDAVISEKDSHTIIAWIDNQNNCDVTIGSGTLSQDLLLEIAEGIEIER